MKNFKSLKISCIIFTLLGILWTLVHNSFGPIMMALGIIFATFVIFKDKMNSITFSVIMALTLAVMFLLEYLLVPIQNTILYILLLMMSLSVFISCYFSFKPQNLRTKNEKILSWTGSILFGISFLSLIGVISNDFRFPIIIGVLMLIFTMSCLLIRRKILKDNAIKDEFNETDTVTDPTTYWFKYEIGGMPKPVHWQGWVCYIIMFSSPFILLIFGADPITITFITVAIIFIVIIITKLKSNYRENLKKLKENSKKQ